MWLIISLSCSLVSGRLGAVTTFWGSLFHWLTTLLVLIFIRIHKTACFFSIAKILRLLVGNNISNSYLSLLDFERNVETEIQPHSKHRSVSSSECHRIVRVKHYISKPKRILCEMQDSKGEIRIAETNRYGYISKTKLKKNVKPFAQILSPVHFLILIYILYFQCKLIYNK